MMNFRDGIKTMAQADPEIYRVAIDIKVKTKDGMIYTMENRECGGYDGEIPFADCVINEISGAIIDYTNQTEEKPDSFWFALDESVSVRNSEIVRIWAEIGPFYTKTEYEEIAAV